MLRMDSLTWVKVKYHGCELSAKANFASILWNSKLIIFGGIKENLWPCNETWVVEFDLQKIEKLLNRDREEEEERLRIENTNSKR